MVTDLVEPTVGRNDLILLVLQQHQQPTNDAETAAADDCDAGITATDAFSWQLR